jgi:hypothetical protein
MSNGESMGSRIFALLVCMLIMSPAGLGKTEEKKVQKFEDVVKELLKKYGSYRPKEILNINDEMPSSDRVDLDNDYFKISYPKCFKAEPADGAEDTSETIHNVAAIQLVKSSDCSEGPPKFVYLFLTSDLDIDKIESYEPASKVLYRQFLKISNLRALSIVRLKDISIGDKKSFELFSDVYIECKKNKKNQIFSLGVSVSKEENINSVLSKKDFSLHPDIRKILSSFKCK